MRYVGGVVGVAFLLLLTGCSNSKWGSVFRSQQQAAVPPAEAPPTAAALVEHLNRNSRQIQSLECMELDMDCRQKMTGFGLRGKLACQKPRNFRLLADALGQPQVDLGSNAQEFWFWIAKADPPYQFHCSYTDFARGGIRLPFPFQPDWVMEALGMGEYGPPENYQLRQTQATLELVENTRSPQGQPVQKITVVSRKDWRVQGYVLVDTTTRKEICAAKVTDVQQVGGVIVPRRVQLEWKTEGVELKLKLDEVAINRQLDNSQATALFTRPQLNNIQSYDLARGPDGQIRRAGGTAR
jgi:hypothetical protein